MRSAIRVAMILGVTACAAAAGDPYEDEILKWREQRETRLKADGGWLTVAGLFWLKEGENRFGTDPASDIVLPEGSAPARAGLFVHTAGRTSVRLEPEVKATLAGQPITQADLKDDAAGDPDEVSLNALRLTVIKRGDRWAIRLKDMNSRFRKEFTGLRWFPVKADHRVTARFVPYDPPRRIPVPNIIAGMVEKMPSPGYAAFTLNGQELRLDPVLNTPDAKELFFIFRDETAGHETYPSGRFLYSDLPADGRLVLDFNKAYTPPCAFTPYATCPLPPEQNRLKVRIEAGELNYAGH